MGCGRLRAAVNGQGDGAGARQSGAVFAFIKSCQLMRFALSSPARSLFPSLTHTSPLSLALSQSFSPLAYIKSISAPSAFSKLPFKCMSVCVCVCGWTGRRGG